MLQKRGGCRIGARLPDRSDAHSGYNARAAIRLRPVRGAKPFIYITCRDLRSWELRRAKWLVGYQLYRSQKQTNYLSNFTEISKAIVVQRYTVITNFTEMCVCEFCVSTVTEREASDGVFADAAEVERVVSFDDVGNLGVAVGGVVLKVVDDAALVVEAKDK